LVGVAVNLTLVPEQMAPEGLAVILTLAFETVVTVIVIAFEVAGEPLTQEALDVITQVIILPLTKDDEVYVTLVAPEIAMPLFFHWYVGVLPPLVGVAVNVTIVPELIVPEGLAAILTLAATERLTVIVIEFDVAGEPVAHVAVDVITQVIILPLAKDDEVYVALVAPEIAMPLFFHWYVGELPPLVGVAV